MTDNRQNRFQPSLHSKGHGLPGPVPYAGRYSSLCRPDGEKSCFRCCPPIRPAGYDHLEHRRFLAREFYENRRAFLHKGPTDRSITGFSCPGLGFLDESGRQIGCLYHPAGNRGEDLRDKTGYGDKCRRELCPEAALFDRLTIEEAAFVLGLADGLDSFEYSSPRANPVFRLLSWGWDVVARLAEREKNGLDRTVYAEKYDSLNRRLTPEIHGPALEILLNLQGFAWLEPAGRLERFQRMVDRFIGENRAADCLPMDRRPFVHQIGLTGPRARFLRSALGLVRAEPSEAAAIFERLERAVKEMVE